MGQWYQRRDMGSPSTTSLSTTKPPPATLWSLPTARLSPATPFSPRRATKPCHWLSRSTPVVTSWSSPPPMTESKSAPTARWSPSNPATVRAGRQEQHHPLFPCQQSRRSLLHPGAHAEAQLPLHWRRHHQHDPGHPPCPALRHVRRLQRTVLPRTGRPLRMQHEGRQ